MKYEVRLAGEGGQGLILGGIILAESAGIYEDYNVVQSQLYGAATRGELSKSEVIISDARINYLKVRKADIFLCLTQDSYDEYSTDVKENGVIIIDPFFVKDFNKEDKRIKSVDLSRTALDITGREITTNIVSLGVITVLIKIITKEAMKKAVLHRIPKGTEDLNLSALEAGFQLGGDIK